MTKRQAIKFRCQDCGGDYCVTIRCPLHRKGKIVCFGNRTKAILKYCKWCMNGHPIIECSEPFCSIWEFRKDTPGDLHVDFLPVDPKRRIL